jgi:protein-disulfide isomerase
MSHRRDEKDRARAAREAAERAEKAAATRRRRLWTLGGIVVLGLVAVVSIVVATASSDNDEIPAAAPQGETATLFSGIEQSGTSLGDPSAPVVLTEFADLQCPFCRDYAVNVLPALIERHVKTGRLRLELRLLRFVGPGSERAARGAEAAAQDDRLWSFVDAFYRSQGAENSGYVTDDFLGDVARAAGAEPAAIVDAANGDAFEEQLQRDEAEATTAGISSTPSFLVARKGGDNRPLQVAELTTEAFEQALRPVLSRAQRSADK